ncbi:MAG: DUF2167 domain-containing protein [Tabrizicola sp.]|nr:DUF2167 domain-containing protein [Tabrizicola sp.]
MLLFPRLCALAILAALPPSASLAEPFKTVFPEIHAQLPTELLPGVDGLDLKSGTFTLDGGMAQVTVPDDYYFLDAADARYVLEALWENPEAPTMLGMIFPRKYTPFDQASWAITLEFDPIGYVSDEDAAGYDYDELLQTMKDDTISENEWRVQNGFEKIELLGWAAEPHYDQAERKLYWAKKLHFDGAPEDTLNYNIRALGRKGVLVMNFIANADQLAEVEAAVPGALRMISFTEGNRYADYVPGVDTLAAVGIGGLIAGKVLASKAGFLVLLLAFAKKGFVLILLPLIWLKNKLFARKPTV